MLWMIHSMGGSSRASSQSHLHCVGGAPLHLPACMLHGMPCTCPPRGTTGSRAPRTCPAAPAPRPPRLPAAPPRHAPPRSPLPRSQARRAAPRSAPVLRGPAGQAGASMPMWRGPCHAGTAGARCLCPRLYSQTSLCRARRAVLKALAPLRSVATYQPQPGHARSTALDRPMRPPLGARRQSHALGHAGGGPTPPAARGRPPISPAPPVPMGPFGGGKECKPSFGAGLHFGLRRRQTKRKSLIAVCWGTAPILRTAQFPARGVCADDFYHMHTSRSACACRDARSCPVLHTGQPRPHLYLSPRSRKVFFRRPRRFARARRLGLLLSGLAQRCGGSRLVVGDP
jgi:hypothetical protein